MIFLKVRWQRKARAYLKPLGLSYAKLAALLRCSKTTAWVMLTDKNTVLSIENMLLISRILGINPLDYIVKDEVQLKLL